MSRGISISRLPKLACSRSVCKLIPLPFFSSRSVKIKSKPLLFNSPCTSCTRVLTGNEFSSSDEPPAKNFGGLEIQNEGEKKTHFGA
ncbi:unnamed protein product [Trifolium pratense]|uniref:Uncharacterized protein n=1 Tax=Trifolium pratense TaxID=57577 RepID=A0ACB0M0P7_TRIPR|nr:unnamed protein product [Trifolium pratense]